MAKRSAKLKDYKHTELSPIEEECFCEETGTFEGMGDKRYLCKISEDEGEPRKEEHEEEIVDGEHSTEELEIGEYLCKQVEDEGEPRGGEEEEEIGDEEYSIEELENLRAGMKEWWK